MNTPNAQGYNACRAGRPLSENPETGAAGVEWREGWLRAERDIDAENETVQFREPK